jgi:isochorismate synthase
MATVRSVAEIAADADARVRAADSAAFIGIRLPDDLDVTRLLCDPLASDVIASYERPDQGTALIAVGEAVILEAPSGAGPAALRAATRRLLNSSVVAEEPELRPRLLGGFRFNPDAEQRAPWTAFGGGRLTLPRLLFVREAGVTGVVLAPGTSSDELRTWVEHISAKPKPNGVRPHLHVEHRIDADRWSGSVANIAAEIRAGLYEKAVLATPMTVAGEETIAIGSTLERLRTNYPACHLFTFRAGDSVFLGASPELLVSLRRGQVRALGLAGSTPRGDTPAEDERLGHELLGSAKNRIEHESVVRAIREGLADVTEELRAPNQPRLKRFRNIQHLSTEITARVRNGVDALDLVDRLHPTPAVCGWPPERARQVIEAHEDFDRGWYAGPIGWVDGAGDGEFAVALRAAIVTGERATLFAGNGIMGDSVAESELAEVQLKLRPLAEALGGAA